MSLPGAGRAGQAGTSAGTVWERRADGHHRFFSQFTITVADVTGAPPASAAVSAGRLRELIGAAGLGLAECSTLRWVHPVPAPRPSGMGCSPARWPPQL